MTSFKLSVFARPKSGINRLPQNAPVRRCDPTWCTVPCRPALEEPAEPGRANGYMPRALP